MKQVIEKENHNTEHKKTKQKRFEEKKEKKEMGKKESEYVQGTIRSKCIHWTEIEVKL